MLSDLGVTEQQLQGAQVAGSVRAQIGGMLVRGSTWWCERWGQTDAMSHLRFEIL